MKIEIITEADNSPVAEFFSSSNTPETDAAQHEGLLKGNPIPTRVVHVNFARLLERERDEAREALMRIEEIFIDADDTYEDFRKMGNIARAILEAAK